MKIAVGGTFNVLHRGHKALLETAFSRDGDVIVGISSDEFAGMRKDHVMPLFQRRKGLEDYLSSRYEGWNVEILEEPMGAAAWDAEIEALVVSPGTYATGENINRFREEEGLRPLELVMVSYVLADDFLPINSTRIMAGEIDVEGRLTRPLRVVVGSGNPVKVDAVRSVMDELLDSYELISMSPDSTVGEQPFHEDTVEGAERRALTALERGDIGVGIEAGVFEMEDGLYDVQYCAIVDKGKWITMGHGSGFRYPPGVARLVRFGKTVSQAFDELYGIRDIGRKEGAIGFLTEGSLSRQELTEQAVMAAMVPRIRRELYRGI